METDKKTFLRKKLKIKRNADKAVVWNVFCKTEKKWNTEMSKKVQIWKRKFVDVTIFFNLSLKLE